MANGELYGTEFGWNSECEAFMARLVADFDGLGDREHNAAWIAELDGSRVGCVFCVADDDPLTARLRILLVDRIARGQGLGARLVRTAVEFARSAGYRRMVLWTNHPLVAARAIYLREGFRLTAEEPHFSFGVDLIGQTYELELTATMADSRPSRHR